MTPPRLTELRCVACRHLTWVEDADDRGEDVESPPYEDREYWCGGCGRHRFAWEVVQQSPFAFLLQPHPAFPMTQEEFDRWVAILAAHFPSHPLLRAAGTTFVPYLPEQAAAAQAEFERLHPVAEMRDQDGARRRDPDLRTALEWLDIMVAGDQLTFTRRDGGRLEITLEESLSARCRGTAGDVLAAAEDVRATSVRRAIEHYLDGNVASCAARLREAKRR